MTNQTKRTVPNRGRERGGGVTVETVGRARLICGDSRDVLATFAEASFDACVTDPPYELGFMGKGWDRSGIAYDVALWRAVLRVLKPGAHLLAFGGTRTHHRMVCAIEDAGFEIRDEIQWLYGQGFPKSLDVSKAIDKAADYRLQAEFRRAAVRAVAGAGMELPGRSLTDWTEEEHAPGDRWWGEFCRWLPSLTKEERETITREVIGIGQSGRNALMGGLLGLFDRGEYDITAPATDAARQWEGWGTALKPAHEPICVARKPLAGTVAANVQEHGTGALNIDGCRIATPGGSPAAARREHSRRTGVVSTRPGEYNRPLQDRNSPERYVEGRPGEAIGRWPANVILDPEAAAMLDEQSGDSGGASRFFYVAKPSKAERGEENTHPTVKPVDLIRYLIRLVTPPGGTVLDPFAGSGTTAIAAHEEGFDSVLIEKEPEHFGIALARVRATTAQQTLDLSA